MNSSMDCHLASLSYPNNMDTSYPDETDSMINHARSSPLNTTISNTSVETLSTSTRTTPPLVKCSNDDDDIDDNDDLEGEEAVENDSLNDTNSHTTIDDDELMNSYTASIGNHDNEAAEYITDDVGLNDQLFPVKKSEKQVTFQDVVEISTIYSIVNESVESVSYTSEVDDAIDEEFLCDNECNGRKDYKGIKYTEDQLNELERHSNADQCSSEKDLLTLYTDWANYYLKKANYSKLIENIQNDLSNGLLLANIIHAVANIKVETLCQNPRTIEQSFHNVSVCFQALQQLGIETDEFTVQDIVDGKLKHILSLFFNLSKFKQHLKQLKVSTELSSLPHRQHHQHQQHQPQTPQSISSKLPTSPSSSSSSPSMIKAKTDITHGNKTILSNHSTIKEKQTLPNQYQKQSNRPPKPPPRFMPSSPLKQINNYLINDAEQKSSTTHDNISSISGGSNSNSSTSNTHSHNRTKSLPLYHQEVSCDELSSRQIKSPNIHITTTVITTANATFSQNSIPSTLNSANYQSGINASLTFTKSNVASLRFPSSPSFNCSPLPTSSLNSTGNNNNNIKPLPSTHQQQQINIRQSIPRANNPVSFKGNQKSIQKQKQQYPLIDNQTGVDKSKTIRNNSNSSNSPSITRSHQSLQKASLTSSSSSGGVLTIPGSPTPLNKQSIHSGHDIPYTKTTDSIDDQQQDQISLSEHRSAPVGISYNTQKSSNLCQLKGGSFEKSIGIKAASDLNIKPSTKTKTIHPPNSLPSKKFSNNKSLSSDSKKSLDPSAQAALKSNIPTGSTTTIITTATTVTTSSHLNQTIISSSSSGSLSPSSSGIPMPRQLNFYQHSNNNNNNMPSSANVRPKDSPVKVVDRAQYLNFSSHSQTALQGNHVMSTYPDSYDNSSHMNKADNKYLTNLPNSTICSDNFGHPSRTLNQYQHQQQPQPQTVQKCYASPMNYDQSMTTTTSTTMGKVQLTNHHSLPSSSMGQQSNYPGYLAGSTFQERSAHQMTNHQMSFPPSQPPPVPPPQPPPPPPPHHQQQHQHHPQQLRPQELQYTSQTINPGNIGVRSPSTTERNSAVNPLSSPTMPPLNTAYLQDTRRYLSGSGSLSEKRNHHHQHSQLQQLQTSASPLHSSLQTRKTSIPYTGDANFGYPPSLNSSSLHNSNNNSNIQQYSSRNHPFVPPISYRPATLTTNVNFVSSAQQCNQPTTMTGITTGTTTTTTSATTFDPTSTTTNKSCIVSRRERSSKDHPSELSQAQQYPTAYSSQNNLSSIQSSKAEMNVTSIPASNPVLHKYSPYTPSSQMQNNQMPGVPQPSENHHSSNHHSYYNYPPHHSSVQTLKTPLTNVNTETPIKSTTNVAFTPSNHSSNKTSRKSLDNTEQRRKARELYVALKQRYPSASQNTPTHDEVPTLSSSSQNTPPMIGRDNPTETITDKHYPQQQSEQPPNKSHEQHSDSGLLVKDPISQNNQVKHNETDRDHPETTQKFDSKNTLEGQSQLNIPKDFSGCDQKANSSLISNAATATNTTTYNNSVSSILLTDNKSKHSATLVETIKNLSYQAVSPDDLIRPCGYQSDGGLECMNIFSPTHSSYNSMKQLTSPMSYQTTTTKSPTSTTTNTTNQQQQQQQIDINDKLYNPSNVLISSLPRNLKAPYLNSSLQFINYQAKKKKSDEENNEMLGNYARRMHERLQEGMRAAQESLWIPDLPELNIMNRLNHSDIMKNISSSMNEGNKTTSLSESETDHLSCSNQNDEPKVKMTPMNPNLNLDKMSSPLSISETGHLPHPLNSRVNCYSSLNLGFHLTNTSVNSGGGGNRPQEGSQAITKGFNSQSINNIKVNNNNNSNNDNSNDVHGEYSHWDLKNGVCSDVEDLLNQHERRLLSLSSGTDDGKKGLNELATRFNSASDTEELLTSEYNRCQVSMKDMNYGYHHGYMNAMHQPSSYSWLRKVSNETVGDGLHNRYFIPPRLSNLDSNPAPATSAGGCQSDRLTSTQNISSALLSKARRRQIEGRSSSVANDADDAERIYGIVPLSPSYLYHQFMPSNGVMLKGMSSSSRSNQDGGELNLPGTISAPPGTPIKLPYAPPASLIGTTSGFSCPDSGSQIINGGVNGSRLSLTSNGSCVSTLEEKQAEEIQKLKCKLEQAEKRVSELTTQLTTNAHVVSAFEQSLNNMSQRLQNLTNTTTKKDSELHELRATIDALRSQTELGLLKKPPINRPCELNRSSTKDTLKQDSSVSVGEQQHTINRTSLTNSNLSLTDMEGNQSQAENSTDRRISTSGTKSSGSNSKKNGWLRNSLGKAFRKKSSSIHSQSDLDCPTSPQHSHTYHFPSDNNNTYNSDSRTILPPDHPSNLPQSPTMDHKGLHIAVCHHSQTNSMTTAPSLLTSSSSTGGNNVLSVLPNNNQLNGLSPSNSSTSSSSWSASGTSAGGGQSSAGDKNDRASNNNNNPRTYHSQSGHSNQSGIQNSCDSDKQMKVLSADHAKSALTTSTKLEPDEKSWQEEVKHLKCQLAERESKLTDVQLEALASAHQVDQLRDEMSRLYSELKYLRTDNERLQILVSHLQDNQKILLSNNNNNSNNNNTMVTHSQQTAIMCNSLPQTKMSRNIKNAAINRSLDIDCTVLDNKLLDDRQSTVSKSAIEEGVNSSSNLFIGLPEMTNNSESLIALVSFALNPSEDTDHKNNESCISDIKVNSTFNIGIIELSKLQTWKSLNRLLINLFECYTLYLNLNCPHDIQVNELKQYCMHVNALNCTWKFHFANDTTSQSAQLNDDNDCPFENPQKLNELLQSHSNNYQTIVQLSIEQFPMERRLNSNEADVYHDDDDDDDIDENLLNTSKNFNNFIMKTLLNRDILYFYLKLFLTYHFIIFYGNDEIFMETISQSICDYICTTVSSTSVKVSRFNFSDGLHTVDQLIDCITQYINDSKQLTADNTNEQSSNWWLILFIESMHQISQEQLSQIINCLKTVHSKHSEEETTKSCRIYLIGLWMETTSLPICLENPSKSASPSPSSSTSTHTIPYPESYHFYTPVHCVDKTFCWIKSEHSLSRLHLIRYLKRQLVHSLVEKFQCQQYMPTLSNPMVFSQNHLEIFLYQIQYFEDLIQWIEQVCVRVDQFLNDVQNSDENSTTDHRHHHHQHFLNPSIFLNLPFNDPVNCESWFVDIWNKVIAELVQKIFTSLKSSHNASSYASLSDPTEWVLSTWPWHKTDVAKLSSEANRLGRQSTSLIRFTEFYQT